MATKMEGASRTNMYLIEPERLTLVEDPEHSLYDPRVLEPVDESLVLSMMVRGNVTPIIVNKNGEEWAVVDGRHRVKAACEANKRLAAMGHLPIKMKAVVSQAKDVELYGMLIVSNEFRKDDGPLAKADKAKKVQETYGYSVQDTAVLFGVTSKTIHAWNLLGKLSVKVRKHIESGTISASAASELSELSKTEQDAKLEELIAKGPVSARQLSKEKRGQKPANIKRPLTKKEIERLLDTTISSSWNEASWMNTGDVEVDMDPYEAYKNGYTHALETVLKLDGANDNSNTEQSVNLPEMPPSIPGEACAEVNPICPESGDEAGE